MPDDFQQTVNLKDRFRRPGATGAHPNKEGFKRVRPAGEQKQAPSKLKRRAPLDKGRYSAGRVEEIDHVYNSGQEDKITKQDLRKINRPKVKRVNEPIFKRAVILLAIILVGLTVYWLFFRGGTGDEQAADTTGEPKWYAVKLVNGEIYYGRISDVSANPVVVNTVYYNYDQLNSDQVKTSENGNLKLIKLGQETYGPSGTMYVYQVQIEKIDELSQDSKALKAILNHEGKR